MDVLGPVNGYAIEFQHKLELKRTDTSRPPPT